MCIVKVMTLSRSTYQTSPMEYSGLSFHIFRSLSHTIKRRTETRTVRQSQKGISEIQERDHRMPRADRFGCNGGTILLDPRVENFHNVVRENISRRAQAAIAVLDAAHQSTSRINPDAHGVLVIFNISYSYRSLGTQPEVEDQVAERDRIGVPEDLAQLNLDIVDRIRQSNPRHPESHTAAQLSLIARLLDSLPVVSLDDLEEDSKDCPVCQEPLRNDLDTPLLLRCNHVIGRTCIERWILTRHNSCPICRSAIFEPGVLPTLANEE